jgi:hypothetical protein
LRRVAGSLGRQTAELESRLEFSFNRFKSFQLEAKRSCSHTSAETLSGDAFEEAAESAAQCWSKPAVAAGCRVREYCAEQMVKLGLAARVYQSNGELARLSLAERKAGIIKRIADEP